MDGDAVLGIETAKKEYIAAATTLSDRLARLYRDIEIGEIGTIHGFEPYEEENGSVSIVCISVKKDTNGGLTYCQTRLSDLKKNFKEFEIPFGTEPDVNTES